MIGGGGARDGRSAASAPAPKAQRMPAEINGERLRIPWTSCASQRPKTTMPNRGTKGLEDKMKPMRLFGHKFSACARRDTRNAIATLRRRGVLHCQRAGRAH